MYGLGRMGVKPMSEQLFPEVEVDTIIVISEAASRLTKSILDQKR